MSDCLQRCCGRYVLGTEAGELGEHQSGWGSGLFEGPATSVLLFFFFVQNVCV